MTWTLDSGAERMQMPASRSDLRDICEKRRVARQYAAIQYPRWLAGRPKQDEARLHRVGLHRDDKKPLKRKSSPDRQALPSIVLLDRVRKFA